MLEAIKRLGYKYSKVKKRGIASKSSTIGMIIADIREEFFAEIIKYTESMCRNLGYNIIFCDSEQNLNNELNCIKLLLENNIDGLILAPTDISHDYHILREQNIPTVLIDRNIDSGKFDFVGNRQFSKYI